MILSIYCVPGRFTTRTHWYAHPYLLTPRANHQATDAIQPQGLSLAFRRASRSDFPPFLPATLRRDQA